MERGREMCIGWHRTRHQLNEKQTSTNVTSTNHTHKIILNTVHAIMKPSRNVHYSTVLVIWSKSYADWFDSASLEVTYRTLISSNCNHRLIIYNCKDDYTYHHTGPSEPDVTLLWINYQVSFTWKVMSAANTDYSWHLEISIFLLTCVNLPVIHLLAPDYRDESIKKLNRS